MVDLPTVLLCFSRALDSFLWDTICSGTEKRHKSSRQKRRQTPDGSSQSHKCKEKTNMWQGIRSTKPSRTIVLDGLAAEDLFTGGSLRLASSESVRDWMKSSLLNWYVASRQCGFPCCSDSQLHIYEVSTEHCHCHLSSTRSNTTFSLSRGPDFPCFLITGVSWAWVLLDQDDSTDSMQ